MLRARMRWNANVRITVALGVAVAAFGLWRLAPGLAHPSIHNWDESAHQAATRGTRATFFAPHIYPFELYPNPPANWMGSSIFLHKPTAPFWFGALMMRLVGVTPLALRLGSLCGALLAALCMLLLLQRLGEPLAGALGGAAFLALPFGYALCQGYMFGDATDCPLAGWVSLAVLLLVLAVERDDPRLAALAGAATGIAYLCKTALGLAPLGLAAALALLGALGQLRGLRWRGLLAFCGSLLVLAVPWNLYTAFAFPEAYRYEAKVTLDHLFSTEFAQWVRPWDGLLNEVNQTELEPLPPALPLVALGFGAWQALRRREVARVALVLWVAASWLVLSVAKAKVPATAWGAVPGALCLVALLGAEARRSAVGLGLFAGAALSATILGALPQLGRLAAMLPGLFVQTRTRPLLAVGLLLAATLAAALVALRPLVRRLPGLLRLGPAAALGAGLLLLWTMVVAQQARASTLAVDAPVAPMREVGLALDAQVPEQSVLFLGLDRDPPCCFELQSLMFWSGRAAYRRAPDLPVAAAHGLHPYLVSTVSQPFAPVPGVPAFAEARAYDLLRPAPLAPVPAEATPLDRGGLLAYAHGPRDGDHDVWTFFVRPAELPRFEVLFERTDGTRLRLPASTDTYLLPGRIPAAPWALASVVGPRRSALREVIVNGSPLPLER